MSTSIPAVEATGIAKSYGTVQALKPTDLKIKPNEYYVLLGPSGGGKTTTLRLIAGLVRPTAGRISIYGQDVTELAPDKRSTSMVFQSYALFPHMTVEQNVAYGLTLRRMPRDEIRAEVSRMLDLVGLNGYDNRRPHELSGGQQQRVQLARSLVLHSDILLLDEPLAALDAKLRKDMCLELKNIQKTVGVTFVHVTHNQEEAMTVADRIGLVAGGELVEQGSPEAIYTCPEKRFTADFIGENNIFDGTATGAGLDIGDRVLGLPTPAETGREISLSVRSEDMRLLDGEPKPEGWQALSGTLIDKVYLGLIGSSVVRLESGQDITVRQVGAMSSGEVGASVTVAWPTEAGRIHLS